MKEAPRSRVLRQIRTNRCWKLRLQAARPRKNVKRLSPNFKNHGKTYSWLMYEDGKGMLCDLCLKSSKKNPFTAGCTNYRTSTLARHLESHDHTQAMRDSVHQSEFTNAESAAHKRVASKERSLMIAMRTAFYIAKNNISIRNYTSMLQLQEENGLDTCWLKCRLCISCNCGRVYSNFFRIDRK